MVKDELCARFDKFGAGQWAELLEEAQHSVASSHNRIPTEDTMEQRADAAVRKVKVGEVSRARQCLTGAKLAPSTEETFHRMQRKQSLLKEALDDLRKLMFEEIRELEERISKEEMELFEKTTPWKKYGKTGGTPKWREGEKVVAKGGVTRMAASGPETSTMQAELPSDDVDDRKVTEDAALAGCSHTEDDGCVHQCEEGGKVSSVKEEVIQAHGSMGIAEVTASKDVRHSETEEDFVMCKHTEEFEGEESPARSKAPPQKKKEQWHVRNRRRRRTTSQGNKVLKR